MSLRIWLTGASGQIGVALAPLLVAAGYRVLELGRTPSSVEADFHYFDLGASDTMPEIRHAPDVIVHLAGQTSAYIARQDPARDAQVNVIGFLQILRAAHKHGANPFVVCAGSITEVGAVSSGQYLDGLVLDPSTLYDVGKVVQGLYLKQLVSDEWLTACRLRFTNVYGGLSRTSGRGYLVRIIRDALENRHIEVLTDGTYTRDYLHVSDAANAIVSAIRAKELMTYEEFMIGSGVGTTALDLARTVVDAVASRTNRRVDVIGHSLSPEAYEIERRNATVDSTRFRELSGWRPALTLEEGIELTIDALVTQRLV